MDLSHLDKKYFIDSSIYNCPFCKRNNVSYSMIDSFSFDWTDKKKCYGYLTQCDSCGKISLHWSWRELRIKKYKHNLDTEGYYIDKFLDTFGLDKEIFYSRPTSYFTLDSRIPEKIRYLIFEAEDSRQANLLVGASACLRKAIYELLEYENSIIVSKKTNRADYQESVKALKKKFSPTVDPQLFDALAHIQEMSSDPLHEGSWNEWDSPKIRFLIELLKAILDEMYIIPDERKKRLGILGQLKSTFEGNKKANDKIDKIK